MNVFNIIEVANTYDSYYSTSFGKQIDKIEKEIITSLIEKVPRKPLLELGCGTGHWTKYFVDQGFEVTGIDNSEAMLTKAREKKLNANFLTADSEKLPFENSSFDVIASITMIEFVENQDEVFNEIYRVLKPKGWLIMGCLNKKSILAKNKDQSETFKNAKFLTAATLFHYLEQFGTPKQSFCVYLDKHNTILDSETEKGEVEPVFMAGVVQKTFLKGK